MTGALLVGTALFAACQSSHSVSPTPAAQTVIQLNQSARLGADLTIKADTLADSRCPTGVQCVWEGVAYVSAVISKESAQQRVRLSLNSQSRRTGADSSGVVLGGQTYQVRLLDVRPYPTLAQPAPVPEAVIQVTKL